MKHVPVEFDQQRVDELIEIYGSSQTSLGELLCDNRAPSHRAYRLIKGDMSTEDITYGELREESERFAAVLEELGIAPGDRVATLMGKSREYLISLLGIWRLGAVHVPLFTAFASPAIAERLSGSQAKLVVCDPTQYPKLEPGEFIPSDKDWKIVCTGNASKGGLSFETLMSQAPTGFPAAKMGGDAPFVHIYTSGTTGAPKGVVIPVRAVASFRAYAEFALGLEPDDVYWCAADPGWAYGLYYGVITTLATGVSSILVAGGFDPVSTIRVLERERVTRFAAAPTVYRALKGSGVTPDGQLSLRAAFSAGEPLTPEINQWAQNTLGIEVRDHYGQTETGMLINNHAAPGLRLPIRERSMGHAMPGWKAAILKNDRDEEIEPGKQGRVAMDLTASPLAWFDGYEGSPEKSAEKFTDDGRWYLTGDCGSVDEAGYFYFSARDDDIIIMAGYRIGPFEVESAMLTHPLVVEAAVIALPDEVRGEVIEAFVVLGDQESKSEGLEAEIQQWVKTHYASHAYPRSVHFVDALPKTPSGKVQRFILKQKRLEAIAENSQVTE